MLWAPAVLVVVVRRRGWRVVRGVGDLLVGLAAGLLVVVPVAAVPSAVVMVAVAGGPRGRLVAEQVVQDAPDAVHRNGLYRRSWPIVLTGPWPL